MGLSQLVQRLSEMAAGRLPARRVRNPGRSSRGSLAERAAEEGSRIRGAGRLLAVAAVALLAAPLPVSAQEGAPAGAETIEPVEGEPLSYEVDIDGVGGDLKELLRRSSELITYQDNPPRTEGRLKRRIESDVATFGKVLRSQGYYAGAVRYDLFMDQKPIRIRFAIDRGPAYRLAEYRIDYVAPPPGVWLPQGPESVGLEPGMVAAGQPIADAQARLVRLLQERGFPLAKVTGRQAVVDHEQRSMTVTVTADQGPLAGYGPVLLEGLEDVKEDYILRLITLKSGKRYDQAEVDKVRARLAETQLFAGVSVEPAEAVNDRGNVPIRVRLTERKHRTVGGSVGWDTDAGFNSEVYWRHRNLLGANEQLRLGAVLSEIEQSLTANLRKPHFGRIDQDLLAESAVLNRETDAFDERSARASVGLQRPFGDTWRGSAGVSVEYSMLEERGEKQNFLLFGLPVTLSRDATDSLLDPTRGHRLGFTVTPYFGTVERDVAFVSATAGGSAYLALDDAARYVLAGRGRVGSIVGAKLFEVPANKRFYAGGGGSVRGYQFQTAGPLDEDDDPIGGRSLMELSAEMRIKVTENIGVVPFFDAGTVFESSFPDALDELFYAAGIGGRYYTGFGPVRLDVAFPLNKRERDDWFQFYVSIGQAF